MYQAIYYRLRSEGDNVLGGVRPSVRPSVRPFVGVCVWHHHQSKVIVCVSVIGRRVRLIARRRSIGF